MDNIKSIQLFTCHPIFPGHKGSTLSHKPHFNFPPAMPALSRPSSQVRPETDYERWTRNRDPDFKLSNKPQYGPDPGSNQDFIIKDPSSMEHTSVPQLIL
jgi:hypothetical protein